MFYKFKLLCYAIMKNWGRYRIFYNENGIILVEVIITIAILGAVITPLMTLFVMSEKLNQESNREFMSILTAQKYIEEIKAVEQIDTEIYMLDTNTSSYTRIVPQSDNKLGVEIRIVPIRSFLYSIEVSVIDNGETINSLIGSKIIQ